MTRPFGTDLGTARTQVVTGRCYCGQHRLSARAAPQKVAYCHCADCRRWTGGPVGAFAAFGPDVLTISPDPGPGFSAVAGVTRWTCGQCGSPLAARFDYLPGQVYVPLGLLDQIDTLPPSLHCHGAKAVAWLAINDTLPRHDGSGRADLRKDSR